MWRNGTVGDVGAIDICIQPYTRIEAQGHRLGLDENFFSKVRIGDDMRDQGIPMEDYISMMDRAGIEHSLVAACCCGDLRIKHSSFIPYEQVREYCDRWPTRFSGLAGINPSRGLEGVRQMVRGIEEYGFVGAHLYPHWFSLPPNAAQYYPFYYECCKLGVPVMIQVGHCLDYQRDRVLPTVGFPITLEQVAIDFPELNLIGIHLGWPWVEEMIAMCYKHQNIHMCGDAYSPMHWPTNYLNYINTFGQNKVLFGTDFPIIPPERAAMEIEEISFRPDARRKMLRDNALRLFKLENRLETQATAATA